MPSLCRRRSTVRDITTITLHTPPTTHVGVYSIVVPPPAISSEFNSPALSLSLSLYLDSNFLELSISPTSLKIIIIRIRITELKGLHVLVIILFNLRDFWPFKVIPCLKPEVQHSKNKKIKKNLETCRY